MKTKLYVIFRSGSVMAGTLSDTCITKAARQFISTLDKPAKYKLYSKQQAHIRYNDNYCVMGDFVIMEA